MIRRTAALGLLLVLTACSANKATTQPTPVASSAPVPGPQLMASTDALCAGIAELAEQRAELAKLEADLKDSNRKLSAVGFYISFRSAEMASLGGDFARLDALGIAAADRLVAQYKSMVKQTVSKLDALVATDDYRHPAADRLRLARQIAALIAAVRPDGPDLAALAGTDPLLAVAYRQAPACASPGSEVPTTPLPAADDGTDLQACADGNCEILVHQIATVPSRAFRWTWSCCKVSPQS